jgi:7-carboxy-7-deazaguanine synthase
MPQHPHGSVTPQSDTRSLPLMEMFPTIQGEGYYTGRPAFFIRLGGCDVGCVWCDVKESWDAGAHPVTDVETMVDCALSHASRFAVITGGEPCMYDLRFLTGNLAKRGFTLALETSGAYPVRGRFDWICLSPKKFKPPLWENMAGANELKVIVYNDSDFEWAERHADQVSPDCRLYLQPEYSRREHMLPSMIDYVARHPRWRIGLQVHKYLGLP